MMMTMMVTQAEVVAQAQIILRSLMSLKIRASKRTNKEMKAIKKNIKLMINQEISLVSSKLSLIESNLVCMCRKRGKLSRSWLRLRALSRMSRVNWASVLASWVLAPELLLPKYR